VWSLRRRASSTTSTSPPGPLSSSPSRSSLSGVATDARMVRTSEGAGGRGERSETSHSEPGLPLADPRLQQAPSFYISNYFDALASAVIHQAEEAALIVQRKQRSRPSSRRETRLTEGEEENDDGSSSRAHPASPLAARAAAQLAAQITPPRASCAPAASAASSPPPPPASATSATSAASCTPGSGSHATRSPAARVMGGLASGGGIEEARGAIGSGTLEERAASALLQKLDDIETRLRSIERAQRSHSLWGRIFGCAAPDRAMCSAQRGPELSTLDMD
jgi:hypothetical protein